MRTLRSRHNHISFKRCEVEDNEDKDKARDGEGSEWPARWAGFGGEKAMLHHSEPDQFIEFSIHTHLETFFKIHECIIV